MMGRRGSLVTAAACGLIILSAAAGCGESSGSSGSSAAGGGGVRNAAADGGALAAPGAFASADTSALGPKHPAAPANGLPSFGPDVIKTATLRVQVPHGKFGDAIGEGTDIADHAGGYVVSTSIGGGDRQFGQLVMRVPARRFGGVLARLSRRLGKVTAQQVRGQEVTAQFIDLAARERNLRAQERVLLRLMTSAQTVSDTIRVQNQLSPIQEQIEQIQGRQRYLRDRASLSTITVTMSEPGAAAAKPEPRSAISQALHEAGDRALGVVTATIAGAGFVLPTALLLAAAAFAAWRAWLRFGAARPGVAEPDAS
jgi:uncharacterized protein DUF4349